MLLGWKLLKLALRKAPLGLLVVISSILPLLIFNWPQTNAARPNSAKNLFYTVPTKRQFPVSPVFEQDLPPPTFTKNVKVGKKDTLITILRRLGVLSTHANNIAKVLSKLYDPRQIKPGHKITLVLTPQSSTGNDNIIEKMVIRPTVYSEIIVTHIEGGRFNISKHKLAIDRRLSRATGSIKSSLYETAIKTGTPKRIIMELIRIYSWDVDFQRDINTGDRFEVLFEKLYTEKGEFVRNGNVLYGNLILRGQTHPLYRHQTKIGTIDYFDGNGKSARKALMRTPINGARLSSRYGKRRHPILGYNKMHRGVDFAAPRGTPVYAAGRGTVVRKGRNGAYGNYIRIRHGSGLETAYAHLSRFNRSIHRGARVRQGQIIGYVGSTGRSTGPHLHYEILKNRRQINPLKVKMPSGRKLAGKELKLFHSTRIKINEQYKHEVYSSGDTRTKLVNSLD